VVPITPRSPFGSQKVDNTASRIAPRDFGARLLRGRELQNRSLQEIADTTKISTHQLRALERGDLHHLPGGIYRRAIVRQYAQAVGLNVEETLRDLASVSTDVDVEAVAHPRGDAGSSSFTTALWSSAAAVIVLGTVAAVATAWYRAGTAAPAAPTPVTATSAPTPEAEARATEAVPANAGDIEPTTAPAVSPPSRATQTETKTETGSAAADATEGELLITSDPAGALVTVNGVGWGATPVTIQYMPFGTKLIRATKSGYMSAQRVFEFVPDRRARSVRIQLSPAPEAR
jgi:cytoskeletal protein RodZ